MKRLPKPYWQSSDGGIVLYHADCLAILPLLEAGSVDAVVTDPPYGMRWNTDSKRFSGDQATTSRGKQQEKGLNFGRDDWGDIMNDDKPFDPSPWLEFPSVVLFGSNHFANRLPVGTTLVWLKKADHLFGTFLSDCELAWMKGGYGVYAFRKDGSPGSRQSENDGVHVAHPTQKPVALMEWCIKKASKDGQTILDPFAGSCTTGVAAIRTGRKCILIEKELKYCQIGAKRLAEACCEGEGQFRFPEADLFSSVETQT